MTTLTPSEAWQQYVGSISATDFVADYNYSTEDAVAALLEAEGYETPDDLGELLESHLDSVLPCMAERWADRVKGFDQDGFDCLSAWAESVIGLGVKSTDNETLTFWDDSRIWHDASFGWLIKESADSNTAMMVG